MLIKASDDYKRILVKASIENNIEIVKLLLDNSANPDFTDTNRLSPLMYASERGYLELVKLFIKYNANPTYIVNGKTALDKAKNGDHGNIVNLLRAHQDTYRMNGTI